MFSFYKKYERSVLITMLFTVLATLFMSGCTSSKRSDSNPSVKEISDKIKQVVDLSQMKEGDAEKLKKFYGIDASEVDEFMLYLPPSNIKADEIAILRVKDKNSVAGIKDKLSKRVQKQSESFKDYLPDEYYLVQKNVLKDNDNYLLLAISKDVKKIESEFDGFFK